MCAEATGISTLDTVTDGSDGSYGVKAVTAGKGVGFSLVQIETLQWQSATASFASLLFVLSLRMEIHRGKEFHVASSGYDGAFRTQSELSLDIVVGAGNFLAERHCEPVFGRSVQSDDEDIALSLDIKIFVGHGDCIWR